MDRRDNEVRYNASKDGKVSRGANVCAVSGVADDALGLIQFNEKVQKPHIGGREHVNPTERQMDAAIIAGEDEIERLGTQNKLTCQSISSAMTDLRDFVLAEESHDPLLNGEASKSNNKKSSSLFGCFRK